MKSTSRRTRKEDENVTAPTPDRNRKFTFDDDVIYEEEEDEDQRHKSDEVIRAKQDNWFVGRGNSKENVDDLVLNSMKTDSESNDYDTEVRDQVNSLGEDDEYFSEDGSYDGSQVYEPEEDYYEAEKNSVGSFSGDDRDGENEIYEYNEYEGDQRDDGGGGRQHLNLHLEVDSFCASTITSRWDDFTSPKWAQKLSSSPTSFGSKQQQQHEQYDERGDSTNNIASYYESEMTNNKPRGMASPLSVPDSQNGLDHDKYYMDSVSAASDTLLSQKRRQKERTNMGEYNWYPSEEASAKNNIPSPTMSTAKWKKNLAVHIDSHDTQVSEFNGIQKKIATSIVAYSPSPTSRGNDSASEQSQCDDFGIEVVQLSVSNSSSDLLNKQPNRTSSTTRKGTRQPLQSDTRSSTLMPSKDEYVSSKQSNSKVIRSASNQRKALESNISVSDDEDVDERELEMSVHTPKIRANLSRSNSTLDENQGSITESVQLIRDIEKVQSRQKDALKVGGGLVNKYRNKSTFSSHTSETLSAPSEQSEKNPKAISRRNPEARNTTSELDMNQMEEHREVPSPIIHAQTRVKKIDDNTKSINKQRMRVNPRRLASPTGRPRKERPKLVMPEDRSPEISTVEGPKLNRQQQEQQKTRVDDNIPESVPSATALLTQKASLVGTRGGRDMKSNRNVSPEHMIQEAGMQGQHRPGISYSDKGFVNSKQRKSSDRDRQTRKSDKDLSNRQRSISPEHEYRDSPTSLEKEEGHKERRDGTSPDIIASHSDTTHKEMRTKTVQYHDSNEALITTESKQEKSVIKSSLRRVKKHDNNKSVTKQPSREQPSVPGKRVTILVAESRNKEKSKSQVASTCRQHVQSLIEGGIFSENSHQIRDLLTVIKEHDAQIVESDEKNDETIRMSEVILKFQDQLKDSKEELKTFKENNSLVKFQKEIDTMNIENQTRQKKHDESLRTANNIIACLDKALNAQLESQKDDKLTGSGMKNEIESLKKTNKNNQAKYEEKLHKAENAITSLENALRAQVGLQKEEKKVSKEKNNRISELKLKCQELEKDLETMNQQAMDGSHKLRNKVSDYDAIEANNKAEKLVADLKDKLHQLKETNYRLTQESTLIKRQMKILREEHKSIQSLHEERIKSLGDSVKANSGNQELFVIQEERIATLETNLHKLEDMNAHIGETSKKIFEENEELKDTIKDFVWAKKSSIEKYESKLRSSNETINSLQKALDSQMTLQSESNQKQISMEMKLLSDNNMSQLADETKGIKSFQEGKHPDKVNAIRKSLEESMRRNVSLGACVATLKSMLPDDDESLYKQYLLMSKKVDIQKTELEKALRESLLREMRISQLIDQLKKNEEQLKKKFKIQTNLEAEVHSLKLNLDEITSGKSKLVQESEKLKQNLEDMQGNKNSLNKEFSQLSKKLGEASKKASRVSELELQLKHSEDRASALDREKSYVKQQTQILQSKIDREASLNDKRMKQQEENYNRIVKDLEQALENKATLENNNSALKERLFKAEAIVSRVPELEGMVNNYDTQCKTYKGKLNDINSRVLELEALKKKYEEELYTVKEEVMSHKQSNTLLESQVDEVTNSLDNMRKEFKGCPRANGINNENISSEDSMISSLNILKRIMDEEISTQRKINEDLTKMNEEAIEKLQDDLTESERHYRETDEELKESTRENENIRGEREELFRKLDEKEANMKRMKAKLEELKKTKRELDEAGTQIESMEMEMVNLKRRLRDSEETITKAEETRSSMKIQISILEESRQASSETVERQYESLSTLQEDFESSKSSERKLRVEVESLRESLEEIEKDIIQVVTARDNLEEESRALRERLCDADALASRVPGLENLITGYEEVVLSQKDDLSSLQEEKLSLMDSVDKLQNDLLVYQTKFSEKQEEVSMVMKEIDIVIKRKIDLEEETKNLKSDLEEAQKAYVRIVELEDRIKDHEETIRTYEDTIEDVKNESSSLLTAMKMKMSDMSHESKSVSADLNDRLKYVEKLKNRLRKSEDTIHSQGRMIETDSKSFENLQNKHNRLEEQLQKVRNGKKTLEGEKIEYEIALEQKLLEIENSRNALTSTTDELNESRRRVESMGEEILDLTIGFKRAKDGLSHMSELQSKVEETEASLSHQKRVHSIDQENYSSLVESMRTELLKASTEKNEVKTEFRTVKECLLEKDGSVKKLEYELNDSKARVQVVENDLKQKQSDLREKDKCIDGLQFEINHLSNRVEKMAKQAESGMKSGNYASNKIVEALQDEVVKMRKKLNDAEEKVADSLHSELSLRSQQSKFESEHRESINHIRREAKMAKNRNLMMERELKQNVELLEKAKRALKNRR